MLINVRRAFVGSVLGLAVSLSLLGWSSARAAEMPAKPADVAVNSKLEEDYLVIFRNRTRKVIRLDKTNVVQCMHYAGPPSVEIKIDSTQDITLKDSNEFFTGCADTHKEVNWQVKLSSSNDQINLITFKHTKYEGSWLTSMNDLFGKIIAVCDGGVIISNTGTPGKICNGNIYVDIFN